MLSIFCSPSRYVQGRDATRSLGAEITKLGLGSRAFLIVSRSARRHLESAWSATFRETLQQTLKDLDRALKDAFSKVRGFPKFKKKGRRDSFRFPQGIKLDNDKIYLMKIGWCKFRKSREIEGQIKNVEWRSSNLDQSSQHKPALHGMQSYCR